MEEIKHCRDSLVIKTSLVLPPDTNNIGTMFGGKLMAYIDDVAAISAMRHAQSNVVTASTDSVDFLHPIHEGNAVCLERLRDLYGQNINGNHRKGDCRGFSYRRSEFMRHFIFDLCCH